ncbi:MAG TPA: demethoxyubiquinone hydroxylase family protein [Alphaproteobacteria bacterium]|nr:demethoxyubiquinone hydroxylase family protein [Alphaproteobacteria bacterium]
MNAGADGAGPRRNLPGDLPRADEISRMLRVDHAGEYGAVRIYAGQLAVLGDSKAGDVVRRMAAQEQRHLDTFDRLLPAHRVRPTALAPLWHVAGFALGAASALLGERAAMACTVAVEEVIDEHYAGQIERLGEDETQLKATLEEFRRDEIAHRDEGIAHGAHQAPAHPLLSAAIKTGSRLAIWLSTRI